MLHCSFCCLNFLGFGNWEFFQTGYFPLIYPHPFIFWALPYLWYRILEAHVVFLASPRISSFSKKLSIFSLKLVFRTKIWVLRLLIATGVSFLIGLLSGQFNICMYTNSSIHIALQTFQYLSICIYTKLNMSFQL